VGFDELYTIRIFLSLHDDTLVSKLFGIRTAAAYRLSRLDSHFLLGLLLIRAQRKKGELHSARRERGPVFVESHIATRNVLLELLVSMILAPLSTLVISRDRCNIAPITKSDPFSHSVWIVGSSSSLRIVISIRFSKVFLRCSCTSRRSD
jgi:hypothetical protein